MELIWSRRRRSVSTVRRLAALVCVALLVHGEGMLLAQEPPQGTPAEPASQATAAEPEAVKLSPDQLDSLVAPIALYPDPLLAQTLAASTYPLELIQLQQWMAKNSTLKDKALADAVGKQPWDPSIQSMAAVPEVVKRLADDIQWTTQLGDAFLDQQSEVMDAVQRMRKKADEKGSLTSNEQQKVETKVIENKTVIVVEPTNPEVVYVPSYNPTVVYPPPVYPYPPVYYPPYYPGAGLVTFGVGMAMGAAIWGGSCCGCGWGGNNTVNINNNNNFNRNTNVSGGNRGQGGSGNWSHNSQHRGGAPYSNKSTANKYGGSARGDSSRGSSAGGRGGAGASASSRGGAGAGASSRSGAGASASSRGGAGAGTSSRGGGAGASASSASRGGGGGGSRGSSAMGGGSGGFSGSSARASSSRGSSSMGSRGGGGGSRGGGGGRRR
jgi:hypothetical protein